MPNVSAIHRWFLAIVATLAAGMVSASESAAWADESEAARPLSLEKVGPERKLPQRILGGSSESLIERLIDDPAKVAAVKDIGLAFDRFPGGSQANYYNWRTGQLEVQTTEHSSEYMRFWAKVAPKVNARFPKGLSIQEYTKYSQAIGAEVVFVPNLETSSVEEQVQWFRQMKREGIVPRYIEMGNEFWIAMAFDPEVEKRWPDEPTTMRIIKQYAEAFRPFLPEGAKVAAQAVATDLNYRHHATQPNGKRLAQWNDTLKPEGWFDAVTIHMYPHIDEIMGSPDSTKGWSRPGEAVKLFRALLAHCDQGVDHALDDVARRVPGKEIWVTEWNPRGAVHTTMEQPTPILLALLTARMTSTLLRHKEMTMSLFFTFNFNKGTPHCMFESDGKGGYWPIPQALAVKWYDEAANGGTAYQRLVEAGAKPVVAAGWRQESFREIEADLFRSARQTTLIIQNCSADSRTFRLSGDIEEKAPSRVEILSVSDVMNTKPVIKPASQSITAGGEVRLPPYSLTRIIWK